MVLLPPTIIPDYIKWAKGDMQLVVATLQFVLAHEMAHLYLRHVVRQLVNNAFAFTLCN